jgi:uncharacterized LabA/DUF88 family protein
MSDRAILFIDGNNWYHGMKGIELDDLGRLDYAKVSMKLLGPRDWVATRYYIGQVPQVGDPALYADQRRFLASLRATDPRISTHMGRLEQRPTEDPAADALLRYLANLRVRVDSAVFHDLMQIAQGHRKATTMVEKAVDVMIAVDMVMMAARDEFDAAYLLSADGDFTPAVQAVRGLDKRVYVASPLPGAQLRTAANAFIRLPRDWFLDCYR